MNPVVKILMDRDGLSEDEAIVEVRECRRAMQDAIEENYEPEDVIQDMLGLEPDYLFDVLDFEE